MPDAETTTANRSDLPDAPNTIRLRGVRVNNLKSVDLDIPHNQFVTLCGVSGSGKTSLALNTLYAEGQRRYVESFSPYTRQFLEQLDKPNADSINGIPPAIAIRASLNRANRRTTVGSATEINEYLRILYSRLGVPVCPNCDTLIERDSPQSAAAKLTQLEPGTRFQIAFPTPDLEAENIANWMSRHGFVRAIVDGVTVEGSSIPNSTQPSPDLWIIVDRLTTKTSTSRIRDSLETAYKFGGGQCIAMLNLPPDSSNNSIRKVDGKNWSIVSFSNNLRCQECTKELPSPSPNLFNFNSALGACETCQGAGHLERVDPSRVIPNDRLSLSEGAISFWNQPRYQEQLQSFLAFANEEEIDTQLPYRELSDSQKARVWHGKQDSFEGLFAFFAKLLAKKSKSQLKDFQDQWYSPETCPTCHGRRLNDDALAFRIGGRNLSDFCELEIDQAIEFIANLDLESWQNEIADRVLAQVKRRLQYLLDVGVGYLNLDRRLNSLSSGEAQRVVLTTSLGSTLVNMLYVLDEPASGLHPDDVEKLIQSILNLHHRRNTLVCVDHNPAIVQASQRILEIGPGAGEAGGNIVFDGTATELTNAAKSLTGRYLSGEEGLEIPEERRSGRGKMKLTGVRGNNLKNIDVLFPLGCLCIVSGVSGSGKSSLVEQTLYPALMQKREKSSLTSLPYDQLLGDNQISDVVLIDQSPIGRSPRSNPVTYVKAFDDVRKLFAEQLSAKAKNFTAGHFSFNVDKGRCPKCEGDGQLAIDMQFLTDVYLTCDSCQGTRFRSEILSVKHRGMNIAQVLEMPVNKAFAFFRGQPKVQAKLKTLIDVGLGYLPLGQPATTLSTGEAQRLKLALYLNAKTAKRCLFIMDEPTAGLHMADIDNLVETFEALVAVGHSLIVVEHNIQLMQHADWIIDLGPGAGDKGGGIIATGTPEDLAKHPASRTGYHLKQAMAIYE